MGPEYDASSTGSFSLVHELAYGPHHVSEMVAKLLPNTPRAICFIASVVYLYMFSVGYDISLRDSLGDCKLAFTHSLSYCVRTLAVFERTHLKTQFFVSICVLFYSAPFLLHILYVTLILFL